MNIIHLVHLLCFNYFDIIEVVISTRHEKSTRHLASAFSIRIILTIPTLFVIMEV
nr:MAG TPA: hypothetical protein [Caudoviricetes sp.]